VRTILYRTESYYSPTISLTVALLYSRTHSCFAFPFSLTLHPTLLPFPFNLPLTPALNFPMTSITLTLTSLLMATTLSLPFPNYYFLTFPPPSPSSPFTLTFPLPFLFVSPSCPLPLPFLSFPSRTTRALFTKDWNEMFYVFQDGYLLLFKNR
jgi:hypothetical protein